MHRFRIPPDLLGSAAPGAQLTLPAAVAHHALHVLRLKEGDGVICFDGAGLEVEGRICSLSPAVVQLEQRRRVEGSSLRLVLGQGLPRGDKLEEILQHGTELGLSTLWPLALERAQVKLEPGRVASRLLRWEKIADEAARQCRRADVAQILAPSRLEAFLAAFRAQESTAQGLDRPCTQSVPARGPGEGSSRRLGLVLYEDGAGVPLASVLRRLENEAARGQSPGATSLEVWLLIGPEGGLAAQEVDLALRAGFERVSLGRRILRTETASLAVLAVLSLMLEDLR